MNEQEQLRAKTVTHGIGYIVSTAVFFGLGWLLMKLLLGNGDDQWANPTVCASLVSMVFVMPEASNADRITCICKHRTGRPAQDKDPRDYQDGGGCRLQPSQNGQARRRNA